MSGEARTWAKRRVAPSPPAKSVLVALGDYAGDHGFAYASVKTLASDTQYSTRQVQRLLADLVDVGLLVRCDMEDRRTKRTRTCAYFFPMAVSRPTEKMIRAIEQDLGGRVTSVSPSPVENPPGEGDMGVTLEGDADVRGRVTLVSPLELETNYERTEVLSPGAREDEAFAELVRIWPASGIDNTDVPAAQRAFPVEAAKVGDPWAIVEAARAYLASPEFKARTYAPQGLDRWLSRQSYRGRLPVASAPRLGERSSGPGGDRVPADVRAAVVRGLGQQGEGFARSYLDPCRWDGEARALTPATDQARQRLGKIKQLLSGCDVQLAEFSKGVA